MLDHVHWLELVLALFDPGGIVSSAYGRHTLLLVKLDSVVFLDVIDILFVRSGNGKRLTVCVTVTSSLHLVLPKTHFSVRLAPLPNNLLAVSARTQNTISSKTSSV